MTKHFNIGEAKTRLSELIAAAVRGEEIVVDKAGAPQVRLVPVENAVATERAETAKNRLAALGMWKGAFEGFDLSLEALKADRGDPDERFRRKFGSPD